MPHSTKQNPHRPTPAGEFTQSERKIFLLIMAMVSLWALVAVIRSYPSDFYPRFWDEAIYAMDVFDSGVLLTDYRDGTAYAPAKLGYGLPLMATVSVFGENGIMYFSTALWALTIAIAGITTWRRFGHRAGSILVASLTFSPLLGKYIAEAAPTLLVALLFTCLWVVCLGGRFWLIGLTVGAISFVDFKWALPSGLAITLVEFSLSSSRSWRTRLFRVLGIGGVAIGLIGIAILLHPPYGEYLRQYITGHQGLIRFAPSTVFAYYLLLFGAAPMTLAAIITWITPGARRIILDGVESVNHPLLTAIIIAGIPILFNSLIGTLKALRFFAVLFPLFAVILAVSVAALLKHAGGVMGRTPGLLRRSRVVVLPILAALLLVAGSDGPVRHLHMEAGIAQALMTIANRHEGEGTISSYNWPVVHYGWGYPITTPPFTMWGVLDTDRWMLLDRMMDRITIESRLELQPLANIDADSLWTIHEHFRLRLQELFSVPADFYASDYYLAESTSLGIPTLRRWQDMRDSVTNEFSVYRVDFDRLRK